MPNVLASGARLVYGGGRKREVTSLFNRLEFKQSLRGLAVPRNAGLLMPTSAASRPLFYGLQMSIDDVLKARGGSSPTNRDTIDQVGRRTREAKFASLLLVLFNQGNNGP